MKYNNNLEFSINIIHRAQYMPNPTTRIPSAIPPRYLRHKKMDVSNMVDWVSLKLLTVLCDYLTSIFPKIVLDFICVSLQLEVDAQRAPRLLATHILAKMISFCCWQGS